MKKTLFVIMIIIAMLLFALPCGAAPFLVCDPQAGVDHYKLTGPAWVPATVPAQPDGSIKMDVSTSAQGSNAITVAACVTNTTWGELCSTVVPFSFARPGAPGGPSNMRLVP